MDDLIAFVKARLDEDEAAIADDEVDDGTRFADVDPQTARFVWRFADEDRVKREVATKRKLIEEVTLRSSRDVAEIYVAVLAAVWCDHPDYRAEWAD
jgi:hypothetical protein